MVSGDYVIGEQLTHHLIGDSGTHLAQGLLDECLLPHAKDPSEQLHPILEASMSPAMYVPAAWRMSVRVNPMSSTTRRARRSLTKESISMMSSRSLLISPEVNGLLAARWSTMRRSYLKSERQMLEGLRNLASPRAIILAFGDR